MIMSDVATAIAKYERDLATGAVIPWDPEHPTDVPPSWGWEWLKGHLPAPWIDQY